VLDQLALRDYGGSGTVTYRDHGAEPLPHLEADGGVARRASDSGLARKASLYTGVPPGPARDESRASRPGKSRRSPPPADTEARGGAAETADARPQRAPVDTAQMPGSRRKA
jgi:hypothetical protein